MSRKVPNYVITKSLSIKQLVKSLHLDTSLILLHIPYITYYMLYTWYIYLYIHIYIMYIHYVYIVYIIYYILCIYYLYDTYMYIYFIYIIWNVYIYIYIYIYILYLFLNRNLLYGEKEKDLLRQLCSSPKIVILLSEIWCSNKILESLWVLTLLFSGQICFSFFYFQCVQNLISKNSTRAYEYHATSWFKDDRS